MGELSFRYDVKKRHKLVHSFRYWLKQVTEYGFAYQRFIALYDTRIFNSPVVITKVATGLPFICGPFVSSRRSFDMETLNGLQILKDGKSMVPIWSDKEYFIEKDKKSFIPKWHSVFVVNNNFRHSMAVESNIIPAFRDGSRAPFSIYHNWNATPSEIVTNRLQDILSKKPDYVLNRLDVLLAKSTVAIPPVLIDPMLHGRSHQNIASMYENLLGAPDGLVAAYDPHWLLDRINDDRLSYITDSLLGAPEHKYLESNEPLLLHREVFYADAVQNYAGMSTTVPLLQYYNDGQHLRRGHNEAWFHVERNAYRITSNPLLFNVSAAVKHTLCGDSRTYSLHGRRQQNYGDYEYDMYFGLADAKHACWNRDVMGGRQLLLSNAAPAMLAAATLQKRAWLTWGAHAERDAGRMHYALSHVFTLDDARSVGTAYGVRGYRHGVSGSVAQQLWSSNRPRDAAAYCDGYFLNRNHVLARQYNAVFVEKNAGSMFNTWGCMVHRKSQGLYVVDTRNPWVHKISADMSRQDVYLHVHRVQYDLDIYSQTPIHRVAYDMSIAHQGWYMHRTYRSLAAHESIVGIHKDSVGIFSSLATTLYLKQRDVAQYACAVSLLKEAVSVQNAGALTNAIKTIWHVRMPHLQGGHDGLLIPVTKSHTDVSAFNGEIGEMAHKASKHVFVTENAMASVLKKPAFLSGLNMLGSEKMYHDVMMDVYNYFIEKAVIKAAVHQGIDMYRVPYNAFVIDSVGHSFKDNIPSPPDPEPEPDPYPPSDPPQNFGILLDQHVWAVKKAQDTVIYDPLLLDVHKMTLHAQAYKAEFANKDKYGLYYFYDTFAERTKNAMSAFGGLQATLDSKDIKLYSIVPASVAEHDISLYDPVVYSSAAPNSAEVIQQLKAFEQSRKEIEEFLSDFGNWAWVYETPNPFDSKTYGIDELLLPEEDPRYEYFEDIIFDKETMTPRDPVKILSPTSFIARYPIEMPIEEFADVGSIYEDSAEKWEQYFGIETDVMREIYLKYYQIWQAKIFEFSTMTMVQSTKKMLEYLYTWIDMYYPVDKMQQALRVFRQIRWFSENAIIRNSQYIISYEYDTLKSNLHTGTCHITNDLDTVTNPTMYVDKPNAVIRNDKTFLGQDAHVTFEIDAPKNTYIKFDLFTEYGKGTALIYLNGVLVRACTSVSLGIIIQIPYTGTTNRVTIVKQGSSNVGEFYIGNISVPNASFKDLSIEFDPVLRAGNKPLEEVAKKMIACANLFANKNEMYAVLKRSSLGFTETYRQMNDYWKLHHQDKTKGKRLTIKQV